MQVKFIECENRTRVDGCSALFDSVQIRKSNRDVILILISYEIYCKT